MSIRRPRLLATLLILASLLCGVGLNFASRALGEPTVDAKVLAFATQHAHDICSTLDEHPTVDGVAGMVGVIVGLGFTGYQTGEILAIAVESACPRYEPLLNEFADTYIGRRMTA